MHSFGERQLGRFNRIGFQTLCMKEIRRFWKVKTQTVLAPAVTTLLTLAVFTLALSGTRKAVHGVPFVDFLAPGLIAMAMLQNAFANSSSSLIIGKVQGNIVDILMPPLSPLELTLGFMIGGVARGLAVAVAVWAPLAILGVASHIDNPALILFHAVMGSAFMALAGTITAIWAEKFDHTAAITNFIIAPLTLLSGTFFSISAMGVTWQTLSHANPFFYVIDGFRAGFIGGHDSHLLAGVGVTLLINAILGIWCWKWFSKGYKIRS